nr:YfhO family protein [Bifidobacterium bifidum]
ASEKTSWQWQWQWHAAGYTLGRYLGSSLLAGAISAFVLLPTAYALTQSKGTYTTTSWNWKLEYNPLKMLAKLVPGSFNFN